MSRNVTCTLALLLALAATPAVAYVGPGAGLSMLGALWGLLVAVIAAIGFVIAWPLRRFFRRARAPSGEAQESAGAPASTADGEQAQRASAKGQGRS